MVFFGVSILAGEQKGAVDICAFPLAVVTANYCEVQRVTHAGEIVFFELQELGQLPQPIEDFV